MSRSFPRPVSLALRNCYAVALSPIEVSLLPPTGEEWLLQDQCVSGDITDMSELPSVTVLVPAVAPQATPTLVLDVWLCFCGAGGMCMMRAVSFQQPLSVAGEPCDATVEVTLPHAF